MKNRPISSIKAARHIARSAQQKIRNKTGIRVSLMLCPTENTLKTPERMLYIIALALGMSPDCYRMKTRERHIAELRFLGAHFLRMHFPEITLNQVAMLFGGLDHSSIISGLMRANNLIYTGDQRFLAKYNTVLKSINLWLRKEASEYALAVGA